MTCYSQFQRIVKGQEIMDVLSKVKLDSMYYQTLVDSLLDKPKEEIYHLVWMEARNRRWK